MGRLLGVLEGIEVGKSDTVGLPEGWLEPDGVALGVSEGEALGAPVGPVGISVNVGIVDGKEEGLMEAEGLGVIVGVSDGAGDGIGDSVGAGDPSS